MVEGEGALSAGSPFKLPIYTDRYLTYWGNPDKATCRVKYDGNHYYLKFDP